MLSVFEKLENVGETNLNPLMHNIPKRSGEDNLLVIPSPFTMRKKQQQISAQGLAKSKQKKIFF